MNPHKVTYILPFPSSVCPSTLGKYDRSFIALKVLFVCLLHITVVVNMYFSILMLSGPHSSVTASSHTAESLDDCGLRFLLAVRHHIYLMGSLPPKLRVALQKQGLKTFNLVWAFHSEATEVTSIPVYESLQIQINLMTHVIILNCAT